MFHFLNVEVLPFLSCNKRFHNFCCRHSLNISIEGYDGEYGRVKKVHLKACRVSSLWEKSTNTSRVYKSSQDTRQNSKDETQKWRDVLPRKLCNAYTIHFPPQTRTWKAAMIKSRLDTQKKTAKLQRNDHLFALLYDYDFHFVLSSICLPPNLFQNVISIYVMNFKNRISILNEGIFVLLLPGSAQNIQIPMWTPLSYRATVAKHYPDRRTDTSSLHFPRSMICPFTVHILEEYFNAFSEQPTHFLFIF